jgi:hypothetical protein
MNWNFSSNSSLDLFQVEASGLASVDECQRLIDDVIVHKDWLPNSRLLIDCRKVSIKDLRYQHVDRSSQLLQAHKADFGTTKLAIVATAGVGFGVANQFKFVTENKTDIKVEVFIDEVKAREWLAAG